MFGVKGLGIYKRKKIRGFSNRLKEYVYNNKEKIINYLIISILVIFSVGLSIANIIEKLELNKTLDIQGNEIFHEISSTDLSLIEKNKDLEDQVLRFKKANEILIESKKNKSTYIKNSLNSKKTLSFSKDYDDVVVPVIVKTLPFELFMPFIQATEDLDLEAYRLLLIALMRYESAYFTSYENHNKDSKGKILSTDIGPMNVNSLNYKDPGFKKFYPTESQMSKYRITPNSNAYHMIVGLNYFKYLIDKYKNFEYVLHAYNGGPNAVNILIQRKKGQLLNTYSASKLQKTTKYYQFILEFYKNLNEYF